MTDRRPYDPLSRFPWLGPDIFARIDRGEFPRHVDATLLAKMAALERRHDCVFVAYEPKARTGPHQLCRHAEAVALPAASLADVRRLERDFNVWLVAYHRDREGEAERQS